MSVRQKLIASAVVLGGLAGISPAQSNFITVTNYVTVTITNVVLVTNSLAAAPPPAAPPPAAPASPPAHPPPATSTNPPPPPLATQKIKYPWNNSISTGLTLARGNTDTTLVSAEYNTTRKTPKNEYSGNVSLAYGEQDSKQTAENYKGTFQWNHLFNDRFYCYNRTEGLRDYIADVDYRVFLGPGLGYYLLKNTNLAFALGGGVNYELQSENSRSDSFATLRYADKFEYKIDDSTRVWQTVEFLPQVDEWDNYLVNFEIGAETKLIKCFTLKTVLDDNFNNRPAAAHEKNDLRLVAGVGYKF
jgi:putative salt-induced outer membrane protein YdiY